MIFLIQLLLMPPISKAASPTCPPSWNWNSSLPRPYGDYCYKFFSDPVSKDVAIKNCTALDAVLAAPRTLELQRFLASKVRTFDAGTGNWPRTWIPVYRPEGQAEWVW